MFQWVEVVVPIGRFAVPAWVWTAPGRGGSETRVGLCSIVSKKYTSTQYLTFDLAPKY